MTACGHEGCYDCMSQAISHSRACPFCKKHLSIEALFELVEPELPTPGSPSTLMAASSTECTPQAAAIEEYGTKISALVRELGSVHCSGGKAVGDARRC